MALLGLLAWVLGSSAMQLHDLRGSFGHPVIAAHADSGPSAASHAPGPSVSAEHVCPLDGVDLASVQFVAGPLAWSSVVLLRPVSDRWTGAPRGPPPLEFAPKTSPPPSV